MGALQVTWALLLSVVTATAVGGAGAPMGVTADDGEENGPHPPSFFALTSNAYEKPLTSPVTVQLDFDPLALHDLAGWSTARTWKRVMAAGPEGGSSTVHVTATEPFECEPFEGTTVGAPSWPGGATCVAPAIPSGATETSADTTSEVARRGIEARVVHE